MAYDYFEAAGESIKDFVLENVESGTTNSLRSCKMANR